MEEKRLSEIKKLIDLGEVSKAIDNLTQLISTETDNKDKIYYLKGNAYRKIGDWQGALNNYQYAIEVNPNSPAKHARKMIIEVLDFYNKDMFNH